MSSFPMSPSTAIEGIMTSSEINISDNMLDNDFLFVIKRSFSYKG